MSIFLNVISALEGILKDLFWGYLYQQGAWSDSKLITELKKIFAEHFVPSVILYREVPHMLRAKYQPNWPNGLEKKSFEWFLP